MLWLAAASRRGDVDTTEQVSDAFTQLEEDHLPDKQNSTSDGARLAGATLPLPAAVRSAAAQAGLSEFVLGIRPEHLHLANGAGELAGEVVLVEELGADALLHVRLAEGGESMVARAEGRKPPGPGQKVTFHVQPDDIFAFNPVTGARLAG